MVLGASLSCGHCYYSRKNALKCSFKSKIYEVIRMYILYSISHSREMLSNIFVIFFIKNEEKFINQFRTKTINPTPVRFNLD